MRLARTDLKAILDYLIELDHIDCDEAYPAAVLDGLRELIPCAEADYQEADLRARRFIDLTTPSEEDDRYWTLGPCPIMDYRARTGDLSTIRMSDVIGRQRYHELPVYRDYFRPLGFDHILDVGLSAAPERYRSIFLLRSRGDGDFSERDRAVLETLRPHFRAREARATIEHMLSGTSLDPGDETTTPQPQLTAREREILVFVAAGRTNTQIAAELWVTPGTVKKHLENVYEKLGVGRRAAAASFIQQGPVVGA